MSLLVSLIYFGTLYFRFSVFFSSLPCAKPSKDLCCSHAFGALIIYSYPVVVRLQALKLELKTTCRTCCIPNSTMVMTKQETTHAQG